MLKQRKQSKHFWRTTAGIHRKRKLANNKRKVFARHSAFTHHLAP